MIKTASPGQVLLRSPSTSEETAEWVGKVAEIAPLIAEHRNTADEQRRTPLAVMDALRAANLHRMWVSKEFGGGQVSIETGSAVVQAIARLDASVAWQIGVQGAIGRLSDYLPEPTARKLFKNHSGLVVGGVNPAGTAEVVDGGFRLSGQWAFASGYAHADWIVCSAFVTEGGEPRITPFGKETRMLFVPVAETHMLDTWHTVGLRGTGSNHYTVPETFVPEDFTVAGVDTLKPPAARPSRAYPVGYYDFGPFTSASTALGVAQDAVATFLEMATAKTPAASGTTVAASHTAQEKFARYQMLVHTAELLLRDTAREVEAHGEDGGDALSALVRITAASVAEHTVAAVNGLYQLAGSSSLYTTSRLERCFRDIHSATKHITLSSLHFETVGQYLLGGMLQMRR
ncbi:acyl-CoA dehydrogenase family protein [Umezawaea sp. Da 62-37]|uniref:acyl-CoA dehydrogenase family protein n=1 Tax=Umezawaea sp. Da 62-37 TaxID=3075927 RepID=UPI0028F7036F|nr:acyl-CoA dehydrogenase family protein [Umezawaea sp. Da 62-37]WNV87626.1 acyl-CoA dehydrogenase family protein [Umezawaea sp. Da 62-37]